MRSQKGQGGQVLGRSGSNQEPAGCLPPSLIQLLDIVVDLAQTGSRTSGISLAGIGGKAGKPSPSEKSVSLSSRHFPPLLEVAGSGGVDDTELDGKVRDVDAVRFFQDVFLKTDNVMLQLELLDRLLALFAGHSDNYILVQELRTMPLFIQNMGNFPPILQERVLKVLEYAVTVANCVPEQELLSFTYLLQRPLLSPLRVIVLSFFEKLLSFD